MLALRVAEARGLPVVWAMAVLPSVGNAADPATALAAQETQAHWDWILYCLKDIA
jgi:hypothetical protein